MEIARYLSGSNPSNRSGEEGGIQITGNATANMNVIHYEATSCFDIVNTPPPRPPGGIQENSVYYVKISTLTTWGYEAFSTWVKLQSHTKGKFP